jgi:hypothetical protein
MATRGHALKDFLISGIAAYRPRGLSSRVITWVEEYRQRLSSVRGTSGRSPSRTLARAQYGESGSIAEQLRAIEEMKTAGVPSVQALAVALVPYEFACDVYGIRRERAS